MPHPGGDRPWPVPRPPPRHFFDLLAQGETLALERLAGLADTCGLTARALADYLPRPGCQAYPSSRRTS
ncbi:hypothetical protein [Streptomyces lydicus]|uniref:hypothetical protein n=1 Tax=Streptomyces lydicus TaxID=47763 RepID=UPI000527E7CB|nr:hypothetical protein [Streptomyces lydicus]MDC7336224.1 hypothetical protein [Streptomyces lydicus]UEG94466.1 hypothetical protein LJ741_30405 [Streptomyces lydicus]